MATETGTEKIKCELYRTMDSMRDDMLRIEILTAALAAFNRPVPEYEPTFRHVHRLDLNAHQLGSSDQA
ncbi:MAG: hypothetical protein ACK4UO_19625 [Pseudolabrys sp.]